MAESKQKRFHCFIGKHARSRLLTFEKRRNLNEMKFYGWFLGYGGGVCGKHECGVFAVLPVVVDEQLSWQPLNLKNAQRKQNVFRAFFTLEIYKNVCLIAKNWL